ncbi:MAG: hypothetical protein ACXVXC_09340 [Nocardioidaceae bacterium]
MSSQDEADERTPTGQAHVPRAVEMVAKLVLRLAVSAVVILVLGVVLFTGFWYVLWHGL